MNVTREKAVDVLRTYVIENPPRRFAVLAIVNDGDTYDGALVAWGLATEDRIDVNSIEPGLRGQFGSMESLSYLFGQSCEIVWIDPEPSAEAGEEIL
jgi:hypothetical protein